MDWTPEQIAGAVLAGGAAWLLVADGGFADILKWFKRDPAPPAPTPEADDDLADLMALKRLQRRAERQNSKALRSATRSCMVAFFSLGDK